MKAFQKIISLFTILSILSVGVKLPIVEALAIDDTPATPLYLFRDTIESHPSSENTTGTIGVSNVLIDNLWETSSQLGGAGNLNSYAIFTESYINPNQVIALSPSVEAGGELCTLNLIKKLDNTSEYIYSVDIKTSSPFAGIRISNSINDSSYYELALVTEAGSKKARFTKVSDATYNTPASPEDWQYVKYSEDKITSGNIWYTLSLSRIGNTFYWSVSEKASSKTLYQDSYIDTFSLFPGIGKLQLFTYGAGKSTSPALFDNIDAKKLGAKLYEDTADKKVKAEVSWLNSLSSPLIIVADYDENDRLLDTEILRGKATEQSHAGYYVENNIPVLGITKKLYVWDSETLNPIFETSVYKNVEYYEVSADKYIYQSNREYNSTFSKGNGIELDSIGTINIPSTAELYVNGYKYTAKHISDNVIDKFLGNAQGSIRFEKASREDIYYSKIYVDYYVIGMVKSLNNWDGITTVSINTVLDAPESQSLNISPLLTIEIEDSAISTGNTNVYSEKNGIEITLNQLKKDDVVAVALNPNYATTGGSAYITNPEKIKFLATDKTIKGMVLDYDDYHRTYTIGEDTYKYIGYTTGALSVSTTYTLKLDPFGRILDEGEAITTGPKFAIAEKFDSNSDKVYLLLADGSTASYEVHSNSAITAANVSNFIYSSGRTLRPVQDRVVTYTISGDAVKMQAAPVVQPISGDEYNANTGKLGAITITEELNIINAQQHEDSSNASPSITDYEKYDAADFKAGVDYDGFAFKSSNTADVFGFLVITNVGTTFTEDSRFAVITKNPMDKIYDGSTCKGAEALYKGEAITLYSDSGKLNGVNEGDVVYFTTDGEGYVKSIHKIYDRHSHGTNIAASAFQAMGSGAYKVADWNFSFEKSTADIQIVSGFVTEVKNRSITFGVVSQDPTYGAVINGNIYNKPSPTDGSTYVQEGMYTFGLAEDCQAYTFDNGFEANQAYKKYATVDASSIVETALIEVLDANQEEVDYVYNASNLNALNDAIAMVVNGDVVCIFVNYPY